MKLTKLKQYLFILLLILLPTQLGLHFWPSWAFVSGIRVDYFSPTLYVTDILVFLLFLTELRVKREELKKKLTIKNLLIILFFLTLSLLNINSSLSPMVSLYKWLKVAELGFLIWFLARNTKFIMDSVKFLLIPVFYESILAVWQFVNQGSIGGLWYWLGERTFNGGTPGIANAVINGQLVLRPYGTLSHPNVLTGFLIVSGLILVKYFPHIPRKINALVIILIIFVVFLTLSRRNLVSGFNLRQQLNVIALEHWTKSPILGTGLGTSPLYPRKTQNYALVHQPIHNIFLLVLAETGVLGILGILGILGLAVKTKSVPLFAILFLGLFDHYFLTLQQGQLILALVMGLSLGLGKKKEFC